MTEPVHPRGRPGQITCVERKQIRGHGVFEVDPRKPLATVAEAPADQVLEGRGHARERAARAREQRQVPEETTADAITLAAKQVAKTIKARAIVSYTTSGSTAVRASRVRPEGMGDVGAFVSQALDKRLANVSRAASLVPDTAALWQEVVSQHYSRGAEFAEAVWDRPLSRPQVEVVAATVSQLNQCFY